MIFQEYGGIIKVQSVVPAAQTKKRRKNMDRQTLTDIFIDSPTLSELIKNIGGLFGAPILVTDDAFMILSSFTPDTVPHSREFKTALNHSELPFDLSSIISAHTETDAAVPFECEYNGKTLRISTLFYNGTSLGNMILVYPNPDFEKPDEALLYFADSIVSKQLYGEYGKDSGFSGTAEQILRELIDGEFSDRQKFELKAQSTYLSGFNPERFALCAFSDGTASSDIGSERIMQNLNSFFHGSHPFIYKGNLIIFLHKEHGISKLCRFSEEYGLKTVISEKIQDLFTLPQMYAFTQKALNYLLSHGHYESFTEQCERYSLIILLKELEQNGFPMDPGVKKLYLADKDAGTELCLTLYTYISCRHSLKETCEKLFTHRNTVLYRIRKIKDEYIPDFDVPENSFYILLSTALTLTKLGNDDLFIQKNSKGDIAL